MEGLLAKSCRAQFDAGDRQRGDEYYRASLVTLNEIGRLGAHAIANGSSDYDVFVSFKLFDENQLEVHCDCPRFQGGVPCKHLWATLRLIEAQADLGLTNRVELELENLVLDDFEVGEPLARLAIGAGSSSESVVRNAITPAISLENKTHIPSSGISSNRMPPKALLPTWLTKLNAVQRVSEAAGRSDSNVSDRVSIRETSYWFAITLADHTNSSRFKIQLYESKTTKDGNWSTPTRVSLRKVELASIRDPQTRRILAMLDWEIDQLNGYRSYHYESQSVWGIHAALCRDTLEMLCADERFVWNLAGGTSLKEFRIIQPDLDVPWQFIIKIEPSATMDTIHVIPGLQRTKEESVEFRSIDRVVSICDSGAVLFQESISVVPPSDTGWIRAWQREGAFEIPHHELESLLKTFLAWKRQPRLDFDERLSATMPSVKPHGKIVLDSARYARNYLSAKVFFKYGDVEVRANAANEVFWSDEMKKLGHRDRQSEDELLKHLNGFPISEDYKRSDLAVLQIHQKWFSELVRHLLDNSWEVIAHGKLHRTASNFDIKVSSGQDWFDLNAQVEFNGQQIDLPTLLRTLRRGEKFVVLDDGSHGMLPEKWLERFSGLTQVGEVDGKAVRFRRNQAMLLDMLLAEQQDVSVDRNFSDWCKRLKKFSGIRPAKQPRGFQGQLRSYQQDGLGWFRFLNEFEFGGCLADDMGLGKTIQVLALLESRRIRKLGKDEVRKPSIVIVPKSLVFNWIEEGAKFAPKLRIVDYTGLERSAQLAKLGECDLVVTTYATFRLDVERLKEIEFDYAILDEAQAIKNPSAQATKAVRLIRADHRLAMTGTPIENHLGDLWSLFDFLNPGMLGGTTASSFTNSSDGDNHRIAALSNAIRPFVLRRTKEQVLTELPKKTEQTLYCDLSPKQKKLYAELRDHYRKSLTAKVKEVGIKRSKIHVLEALLRLRQAACDPRLIDPKQTVVGAKLELLVEQLSDVVDEGHKVLVFSQFTSLLALVKKEIEAKGWEYEYLDGKTTKRADHVKRFQEDPKCSLFLISLKAGGLGLNLTAAEYVYILDPWWNPAVEAQAIDRAHRIGQQKPVIAYRMIARGTVEDKIVQLQQSKRQLADAIITADQSLLQQLSLDDLQVLFE